MNQGILRGAHKPVAVDSKEAAGDPCDVDVAPTNYFSVVLGEPSCKGRVECLARVNKLPFVIEGIYALELRSNVGRERMFGAGLKFLDKLLVVGFVEFENEVMLVAHDRPRRAL